MTLQFTSTAKVLIICLICGSAWAGAPAAIPAAVDSGRGSLLQATSFFPIQQPAPGQLSVRAILPAANLSPANTSNLLSNASVESGRRDASRELWAGVFHFDKFGTRISTTPAALLAASRQLGIPSVFTSPAKVRSPAQTLPSWQFPGQQPAGSPATSNSPYQLRWQTELWVWASIGGALASSAAFDVTRSCPCTRSEVNSFDRGAAGRRSDGIARGSDIGLVALLGAPFLLDYLDVRNSKGADWWKDAIVMGEAVVTSVAVNQLVKKTVDRPRPLLYGLPAGMPELDIDDNYLSFYSMHSSVAFAAGLSYARTFSLRHPHSRYRALVYATAIGAAAAIATLRVVSGRHFPTDVLTGAAAGTAAGLGIPWLHGR